LNGEQISTKDSFGWFNMDADRIPNLKLKKGPNLLVIKVSRDIGDCKFAAKIVNPKTNKPVKGLSFGLK
jgi:hypothetical protein